MLRQADDVSPADAAAAPRTGRWLTLVLCLGLSVRLALAILTPGPSGDGLQKLPDQVEYVALAEAMLDFGPYAVTDERYVPPQTLVAQRMPGYPLFLAVLGTNETAARIVQALLDVLTAYAAFLLAKAASVPGRWPLVAAAAIALDPLQAYFSSLLLTETTASACVAWGMLGVVRGRRRGVLLGLALLAIGVYLRPSMALVFLAVVFALAVLPRTRRISWPLPPMMTAVVCLVLLLLPWAARNKQVLGSWVWTTTNGGITLYDGWNFDNTDGGSDQSFVRRMPQLTLLTEVERDRYLRERAWQAVLADPPRAAVLSVKKVARTWSPWPRSAGTASAIFAAAVAVPVLVLALFGVLVGRASRRARVLLAVPIVAISLAHAATVGSPRYRLPVAAPVAVLAAAGAARLLSRRANPASARS